MIDIPSADLPKALDIPQMHFKPPTADVPAYKPMVIPPSDLEALDIQMPIPETAVVVTAVTTAVVAVATTSVTQSLFEPIKKKVQKQLQAKVNKWKENRKKKRKDSSES